MSKWPIGYCERDTHRGTEHGFYMSSDGGCVNFVPSWRLLEIKQLFDAAALLAQRIEDVLDPPECPTNHCWLDHNVPGASEWEKWATKGYAFCPDCGTRLQGGEG